MGKVNPPQPALLLIGVISADEAVCHEAGRLLAEGLGVIHELELKTEFSWSDYYAQEMGENLRRSFFWAETLLQRDALVFVKLWTNRLEDRLKRADGSRRVNLDPGLFCLEGLQLASTKNNGCRIYLGRGIFAELTLRFEHGAFRALPWTYPDYGSMVVQRALLPLRRELKRRYQSEATALGAAEARSLLREEEA